MEGRELDLEGQFFGGADRKEVRLFLVCLGFGFNEH